MAQQPGCVTFPFESIAVDVHDPEWKVRRPSTHSYWYGPVTRPDPPPEAEPWAGHTINRSVTSKPATRTATATTAAATAESDDGVAKGPRNVRTVAPVAIAPAMSSGRPIDEIASTPSTSSPPAAAARSGRRADALHRRIKEAPTRAPRAAR